MTANLNWPKLPSKDWVMLDVICSKCKNISQEITLVVLHARCKCFMLPSNKIKVGCIYEEDFFPQKRNSAVQWPCIAAPSCRLYFPNLLIWAPKWHHSVGFYFLQPNLSSPFWAFTTCSGQPPHWDATEMCLRGPPVFCWWHFTLVTPLLTFSPNIMHHSLLFFFSRKHFSSQEMGIDSKMSPYVPSIPAHFSQKLGLGQSLGLRERGEGQAQLFLSGEGGSARWTPGRSLLHHYFPVIQGTGVVVPAPTPALGLQHHLTPQITSLHGDVWNTGAGTREGWGPKDRGRLGRKPEDNSIFAVLPGCSCLGFLSALPVSGRSPPRLSCQLSCSRTAALSWEHPRDFKTSSSSWQNDLQLFRKLASSLSALPWEEG